MPLRVSVIKIRLCTPCVAVKLPIASLGTQINTLVLKGVCESRLDVVHIYQLVESILPYKTKSSRNARFSVHKFTTVPFHDGITIMYFGTSSNFKKST